MQLTTSQNKVINKIINYYLLNETKIINFKAPTGSGKTFMAANIISKIIGIEKDKNQKVIFIIATLSSSDLPKQMEDNLNEYNSFVDNRFIVKREESPSSNKNKVKDYTPEIKLDNNKVIILGKSSFGKARIFTEQGVFENFIQDVKNKNYKLVYIRDEAHWGMDKKVNLNINELKFENLILQNASFTIKMTATPNGKEKLVELTEQDLLNDDHCLLKQKVNLNQGIESPTIEELDFLDIACKKFKNLKNKYHEELILNNENINPAMLIQVDNNDKEDFDKKIEDIIKILEKNGLTWLKYFGSSDIEKSSNIRENVSLKQVSKNSSSIDAIIFKIGPATGWNIPRAAMLVQLRSISSSNLNIQTIGRIKRNPLSHMTKSELQNIGINWENIISNEYFLYSNYQEKSREMWQYQIKEKFENLEFKNFVINYETIKEHKSFKEFISKVYDLLIENTDLIMEQIDVIQEEIHKKNYIIHESENIHDDLNKINSSIIKEKIRNNIELQIFNNKFIEANINILNKEVVHKIWEYIEDSFISIHKTNPIENSQIILYVIFKFIFSKLKQEYKNIIKNIKKDFKYKTESSILAKQYNIWHPNDHSNDLSLSNQIIFNKYAYLKVTEDEKNQNMITFDSKNEYSFINELYKYLWNNYGEDWKELNNLEIWFKNPSMVGVYVEYTADDTLEIKKSYPDLILKSNINTIYIEIKSIDDIDEDKTKNIIEGYKQYDNLCSVINTYLAVAKYSESNIAATTIEIFGLKDLNEKFINKKISTIKKLIDFLFYNKI